MEAHSTGTNGDVQFRARGGAIASVDENVDLSSSDYDSNEAIGTGSTGDDWDVYGSSLGGAIAVEFGYVTNISSTFTGNAARATADGGDDVDLYSLGGAVAGELDTVLETHQSTFTNNVAVTRALNVEDVDYADASGGAIGSFGNGHTIEHGTFIGNAATLVADEIEDDFDGSAWGGAVYEDEGEFEVEYSYFASNSATVTVTDAGDDLSSDLSGQVAGGALATYSGEMSAYASTFESNIAHVTVRRSPSDVYGEAVGGALFSDTDNIVVINSTLYDNQALATESGVASGDVIGFGGAIMAYDGIVDVAFSTLVDNAAAFLGDHVAGGAGVTSHAAVFAGANAAREGCIVDLGSISSNGYNFEDEAAGTCTDGHDAATDFGVGDDPELAPLAYAGGFTPVMAPASTSPLVGHIPGASCVGPPNDQRGVARPSGPECEPGAVEYLADRNFTIPTSFGLIPGTASGTTCSVFDIGWTETSLFSPTPPTDVIVPYGLSEYTVCPATTGGSVTITLDLPSPVNTLYKVTDGEWGILPSATFDGTTVTFVITDGGLGDDDGSANGEIVDPVGPAIVLSLTG